MNQLFRYVHDFFDQADNQGHSYKITNKGFFFPSAVLHIYDALKQLIDDGVVTRETYFLDAGSGDGRIVIVAAMLGIPVIGIESDLEIYTRAQHNINKFQPYFSTRNIHHIYGDFFDDHLYDQLKLSFADISVIFNYVDNYYPLVDKVVQSQNRQFLLIYNGKQLPFTFDHMIHIQTLTLRCPNRQYENYDNLTNVILGNCAERKAYLHVYSNQV